MRYQKENLDSLLDHYLELRSDYKFPTGIKKRFESLEHSEHCPEGILIAECLLQSSRARLPSFISDQGQSFQHPRQELNHEFASKVAYYPQHLLTINWGGAFPCNEWLEKYHCFSISEKNLIIVTGSIDSSEMYGYCDFTLGAFAAETQQDKNLRCAGAVLFSEWSDLKHSYNQSRWTEVVQPGLISEEMALGMSFGLDW